MSTFRSLPPPARLAAIGALAVPGSMLFPWYGVQRGPGLSLTGFDSFGLGQLALLLTVGAAVYLIVRCAGGYELPRPLREGSLLALAGGVGGHPGRLPDARQAGRDLGLHRTSTCATGSSSPWGGSLAPAARRPAPAPRMELEIRSLGRRGARK